MSFFEPGSGEVVFELEVIRDHHLRSAEQADPALEGLVPTAETPDHALQRTAQYLVEIMHGYSFVLAAGTIERIPGTQHADLRDCETGSRLRLSPFADHVLAGHHFDCPMREFLVGLTREGVGAVALAAGGRLHRAQIHHMLVASDAVLAFVRGDDGDRSTPDPAPHTGAA